MDLKKENIKAEALRLGFSFIGFSKPEQTPHFSSFENWLNEPSPEELEYLHKKYVIDARKKPGLLLEGARSVITLGIGYPLTELPNTKSDFEGKIFGQIAAYACLPDYHRWFKDRTSVFCAFLKVFFHSEVKTRLFVDSGPVMEKDFAYQAGLGWIGKNSLFISKVHGSFCLLGCLFTNLDIEPDSPDETDLCGQCDLCLQSCPTQAITASRTINSSRCIAFLTTNSRGKIPDHLSRKIGDHVFGCDICQTVCPLNSHKRVFEPVTTNLPTPIISNQVNLPDALETNEALHYSKYASTPIGKLPYEVFLRNLIIAAGNSGEKSFIQPLVKISEVSSSSMIQSTAQQSITNLER